MFGHPEAPYLASLIRRQGLRRATNAVALLALSAGAASVQALEPLALQANASVSTPSLTALHSDLKFSVATGARAGASDGDTETSALLRQTERLVPALEAAARGLYPEMMMRIARFDVYLAISTEIETRSSPTGKIAINSALGKLQLTDDSLAFVIAREMGHVLGGHHEDNSAASIVTSILMNLLLPGSSLIKSAVSMASSEIAASSGSARQIQEADEIAIRLLETAGYRMHNVALSLATEPSQDRIGSGSWARAFRQSSAAILATARPLPASLPAPLEVAVADAAPPMSAASTPEPLRLSEEPLMRTRPSGIAGPLLLGGYAVPSRRTD